ncbi:PIN2/TERF1-interacting telomerase inhibitor 1 [Stegastes partitus]|uniref:PIN2 (TERF1) interacting telomerase inhibitor 1 n=1 Tax=Stegastes partitus TaxID=144197 RepID=A0A3B5ARV1_9TELE|nr:PREDICTED: PIN2/TERF1-interacting telomerase inhibitor 1 [Stegastes partitus]
MSMLAEPRRKQKWSVDPRNSSWSNDDSKFGQKMLERMGWSKGKGLGRTEQGSTDHIKVRVKNNSYGLGADASHEDNWIAHQDDFNQLLAQLNSCHSQSSSSEPAAEEQKGFSLEEKSKTSRKRVHYMKFTKGKDLSSRSETDLNCIFGKRSRTVKASEQDGSSSDSQTDSDGAATPAATPAASELDTESITKTVTSSLTMQEYFAQRMAQLKARRAPAPSEEPEQNHSNKAEEPTKKKKRKKKKKKEEEEEAAEEEIEEKQEPSKKKKRKVAENEDAESESCSASCGAEVNCNELPAAEKKKKKKKKSKKQNKELLDEHEAAESPTVEPEGGRKKKKKLSEGRDDENKSKKNKNKHLE